MRRHKPCKSSAHSRTAADVVNDYKANGRKWLDDAQRRIPQLRDLTQT